MRKNVLRRCWAWVVFALAIAGYALPAQASGAFHGTLATDVGLFEFVSHTRKIYVNAAQGERHRESQQAEFVADLGRREKLLSAAIKRAQRSGLKLLRWSPLQPTMDYRRTLNLAKLPRENFPVNLRFTIANIGDGDIKVTVTLARSASPAALRNLQAALKRALTSKIAVSGESTEGKAPVDHVPTVVRSEDHFVLSLSPLVTVSAGVRARIQSELENYATEILPTVKSNLETATKRNALGHALLAIAPAMAKQGRSAADIGNLWGPLVDGSSPQFLRGSAEHGAVRVSIAVAMKKHDWNVVNPALARAISGFPLNARQKVVSDFEKLQILSDSRADEQARVDVIEELETHGGPAFWRVLARMALSSRTPEDLRERAINTLAEQASAEFSPTLLKLFRLRGLDVTVRANLATGLGRLKELRAIPLLQKIVDRDRDDQDLIEACRAALAAMVPPPPPRVAPAQNCSCCGKIGGAAPRSDAEQRSRNQAYQACLKAGGGCDGGCPRPPSAAPRR